MLCRLCRPNGRGDRPRHGRALESFSGSPAAFVYDLKSGVHRWHRYDPDLNQAYAEFAEHYSVAIPPACIKKPRDKAKVETGVGFVERLILARLRNHRFFLLGDLNTRYRRAVGRAE